MRGITQAIRCALVAMTASFASQAMAAEQNQVIVIGALHQLHGKEPSFDYAALERAVRRAAPAVIVLEVRADELQGRTETPGRPEYPAVLWQLLQEVRAETVAMEPSGDTFRQLSQRASAAYAQFKSLDPVAADNLSKLESAAEAVLLRHWRSPADTQDRLTAEICTTISHAQESLAGPELAAVQAEWDAYMVARVRAALLANPDKRILVVASYKNRAMIEEAVRSVAPDRAVSAESWLKSMFNRPS